MKNVFRCHITYTHRHTQDYCRLANNFYTIERHGPIEQPLKVAFPTLVFRDEPKLPPSEARALQKMNSNAQESFWRPVMRILSNRSFLILWNTYGINVGALNAVSTLLNPLYLAHFEVGTRRRREIVVKLLALLEDVP